MRETIMKSFDHSAIAALPEYHALRKALSDLGNVFDRGKADLPGGTHAGWLRAVREMTQSAPHADSCSRCERIDIRDDEDPYPPYWPHKADVKDGWLTGTYRCKRGHTWTCGYAVRLPFIV